MPHPPESTTTELIRVKRHEFPHAHRRPASHPLHAVRHPVIPTRSIQLSHRDQMPNQVLRQSERDRVLWKVFVTEEEKYHDCRPTRSARGRRSDPATGRVGQSRPRRLRPAAAPPHGPSLRARRSRVRRARTDRGLDRRGAAPHEDSSAAPRIPAQNLPYFDHTQLPIGHDHLRERVTTAQLWRRAPGGGKVLRISPLHGGKVLGNHSGSLRKPHQFAT